jgi:type II secretory pathway component PulF
MGVFDFQTALIQIVTGLALVGVATIITDLMGEYVIPDVKAAYRKAKYPLPANLRGT